MTFVSDVAAVSHSAPLAKEIDALEGTAVSAPLLDNLLGSKGALSPHSDG